MEVEFGRKARKEKGAPFSSLYHHMSIEKIVRGSENEAKKVLVIEDDADVRSFASWLLELEGYRVLQDKKGDEGLKLARRSQIDLVLLDLRLTGLDGWSVLEQLKNEQRLASIPVVVFTDSAAISQRTWALATGAIDYLVKLISAVA